MDIVNEIFNKLNVIRYRESIEIMTRKTINNEPPVIIHYVWLALLELEKD